MDWFARNHDKVSKWNDMFSKFSNITLLNNFCDVEYISNKKKLTISPFISKNLFQNKQNPFFLYD